MRSASTSGCHGYRKISSTLLQLSDRALSLESALVSNQRMNCLPSLFPILENGHPHENFVAARELEARLQSRIRGEVRFDSGSRALYATDASNYRQVPIGLVIPRDANDVEATVAACRAVGAPILARGGGTSLSGQCCNVAVILDFSKYL